MSLPADRIYLFDTSIWDHTKHPLIAPDWEAALRNNQLAVSPIVAFEVLYIAQNQAADVDVPRSAAAGERCDFFAAGRRSFAVQTEQMTRGPDAWNHHGSDGPEHTRRVE